MMVREPAVAGQFYPADRTACLRAMAAMRSPVAEADLPQRPVAGIVPHAGWMFSGATALAVFDAILARRTPQTFVLFGASHTAMAPQNAVFPSGTWQTPLGEIAIDEPLAAEILSAVATLARADPMAHEGEHSIEVQIPFIQHLFPAARIVPILVSRSNQAVSLGRAVGEVIRSMEADAVCIGSSDLTHYGPMYGFTPKGMGAAALAWVRDENDKRMLDLLAHMDAEGVAPEAKDHLNACGAGAIAATLAAARVLGAPRGHILHYTTSHDVMREEMGRAEFEAAVGYAGVLF
jgi:MEMO1 family protein